MAEEEEVECRNEVLYRDRGPPYAVARPRCVGNEIGRLSIQEQVSNDFDQQFAEPLIRKLIEKL